MASEKGESLSKEDLKLIDDIARAIVRRKLTVPAIVFLESVKPLTFLGTQVMVFLDPFIGAFFAPEKYRRFYNLMEDRKNVELLISRIEHEEDAQ